MNVSDAAAGATRLTSPQDSANSKLKNAPAIAVTPKKKFTQSTRNHRPQSGAPPQFMHVADLLHGARQKNIPHHRRDSDAASYLFGETIEVNGGQLML